VASDNRLDHPWRQKPKRYQSAHRSAIETFTPCDLVNRQNAARHQLARPFACAGYRPEQRKINSAGNGAALKHQPQLDTSPLHSHWNKPGETKMALVHAAITVGWKKRQLERDLYTIAAKRYPFHQFRQRWRGFALGTETFDPPLDRP
jgi:hypothetical protein